MIPTDLGFTGHLNDAGSGLVYMQQRYYDPIAGRFLSVDPIVTHANSGKSHGRYHYANNNPYKYVDLDGRDPWYREPSEAQKLPPVTVTAANQAGSVALTLPGPGAGAPAQDRPDFRVLRTRSPFAIFLIPSPLGADPSETCGVLPCGMRRKRQKLRYPANLARVIWS